MRDEAGALHAKNEAGRCIRIPALITRRTLERIKRTVDLDGVELAAGKFQLEPMRQLPWIKNAAPGRIGPPGNPNVQIALRPSFNRRGQMISRESCHKIPCFSQSFRNVDKPSFSCTPYW